MSFSRGRGIRVFTKVCVSVFLLSFSLQVIYASEDIILRVNGKAYARYDYSDLLDYSYAIPDQKSYTILNASAQSFNDTENLIVGISLDEIFPVMVEAWELKVVIGLDYFNLKDPELAELLPHYLLFIGKLQHDGSIQTAELPHIELDLIGEVSTEKSMEIWVSWEGINELKAEIQRFATMHAVEVHTLEVPKISSKLVQTQRGGGAVPDVVMVQADYINELVQSNAIQALDYLDSTALEKAGKASFSLYGKQWAIPFYYDSQIMICNADIFTKANINPTAIRNLSDLQKAATTIRDASVLKGSGQAVVPMSWNVFSAYWLLPFQYGFGKTYLVESNGSIRVNDKPTIDAVAYLLSLIDQGLLSADERDAMLSNFVSGRTAIMLSASYMIPELIRLNVPFHVLAFPINQDTGRPIAPILDFKGFSITKRSRNTVLAKRLIQYLCGLGVQQRFPNAVYKLPALPGAMLGHASAEGVRNAIQKSASAGVGIPADIAYGVYKNILWNILRLIIDRKFTISDGLNEAQRLIDAQLKDLLSRTPSSFGYTYITFEGENEHEATKSTVQNDEPDADSPADTGNGFFDWLRKLW